VGVDHAVAVIVFEAVVDPVTVLIDKLQAEGAGASLLPLLSSESESLVD